MLQDIRQSLRQLRKQPGFTLTTLLTLALGIGAATAVFSVAYGVLIDPFPYRDANTLATPKVCASDSPGCFWDNYTPEQFLEIREKTDIFEGVTASTVGSVTLTGREEPQRIRGNYLTANSFDVLGVQPILGRAPVEDDAHAGGDGVALLSYRYWQAHFGGSRAVLGRVLTIDGARRTVIGVMPPRFLWRGADVYLPVKMVAAEQVSGQQRFTLIGRLKPGVSEAKATAELEPIFREFAHADPRRYPKDFHVGIMSLPEMFQSGLAHALYLLLGAVSVLLLIACVNVSSLLLARAVKREHEFVVRAAVGASRLRLVRYALTESLLLALVAMPGALLFAYAGLQAMLRLVPKDTIPDEAVITLNLPVLLVSLGIALLTVLLFGLSPAWHSAHPRLAAALGSIRASGGRAQRRLLHGFVVVEIALTLALLTLAGLATRSLLATERVQVTFPPDRTLLLRVPLDAKRYSLPEDRIRFFRRLLEQVRSVPGANAVTLDTEFPFLDGFGTRVRTASQAVAGHNDFVNMHTVTPEYLPVAGQHMLQGHFIDAREVGSLSRETVVSESFVKRYFPDGHAVGQVVHLVDLPPEDAAGGDAFTIVGVIANPSRYPGYRQEYPHIYLPWTTVPVMDTVVVSTGLAADDLVQPVRQAVYAIDRNQPVSDAMSLRQLLDMYGYAGPRFLLALFGSFACAALMLSLIGIYGVLSFVTTQRTQEIGIRMALGAGRRSVMWLVLRQSCLLALVGVAAGLPLAYAAGQLANSELGIGASHGLAVLPVMALLLVVLAVSGTWLPARRAAAIEPSIALRKE